jgi:hypothetical protein
MATFNFMTMKAEAINALRPVPRAFMLTTQTSTVTSVKGTVTFALKINASNAPLVLNKAFIIVLMFFENALKCGR